MTRYYYAQECPRGIDTASKGDTLIRFTSAALRDAWCAADNAGGCYGFKRDVLSRASARRWYPAAFAANAPQNIHEVNWMHEDYWDYSELDDGERWSGSPSGGVYATI